MVVLIKGQEDVLCELENEWDGSEVCRLIGNLKAAMDLQPQLMLTRH